MTPREMFLKSFERPANYYTACPAEQWLADFHLGILDWEGDGMDEPGDLEKYMHRVLHSIYFSYQDCPQIKYAQIQTPA